MERDGPKVIVVGRGWAVPPPALQALAHGGQGQSLRVHTAHGLRPLAPTRLDLLLPRLRAATRAVPCARHETLATWSRRVLGPALTRRWLEPQVRAAFGAAPETVGASDAWPRLLARVARHGARALKDEHLLPTPGGVDATQGVPEDQVAALEAGTRPAVVLHSGERIEADRIVLALPPRRQAALLENVAPGAADDLHAWPMADRAEVRLVVPPDPHPERWPRPGAPDLVGRGSGLRSHCFAASSSSSDGKTIHAWLGGPLDPDALALDDALLARIVEVDLGRVLGRPVAATKTQVLRFPRSLPIPRPGTRARLMRIRERLAPRGIVLEGPP